MKINILGTEYEIIRGSKATFKPLETRFSYTDPTVKRIVIDFDKSTWEFENKNEQEKRILRHEVLHAFLFESGLDTESNFVNMWARNEEMIDWFAIQTPKIYEVYKQLDIL